MVCGAVPLGGAPVVVGQGGGQDIGPVLDKALDQLVGTRVPDMKVISVRTKRFMKRWIR